MTEHSNRSMRQRLMVVELEGAEPIARAAAAAGWDTVFVDTGVYDRWLPKPGPDWTGEIVQARGATFIELLELAHGLGVRSILPVSLLEPETLRDALLRDYAEATRSGVRVLANRPSVVELTYDKWLTKQALADADFPVVPAMPVSTADDLRDAAGRFGFPLACKPRRGFTGQGFRIFERPAEVDKFAGRHVVRDLVAEPFLHGAELTVEVIRDGGRHVAQPVVYKGETRLSTIEHPIYRPRVAPWRLGQPEATRVTRLAVAIATELQLIGAAEMEFIVVDGDPYLLEVNPRVSGATRLAAAAGGHDTFSLLAGLATAAPWSPAVHEGAVAMALPIVAAPDDPRVAALVEAGVIQYVKPVDWMPMLPIRASVLLRASSEVGMSRLLERAAPLSNAEYLREAHDALYRAVPARREMPARVTPAGIHA